MSEHREHISGERMAAAIAATLPIIAEMFAAFPYAEKDGDDIAIKELRDAHKEWVSIQSAARPGDML